MDFFTGPAPNKGAVFVPVDGDRDSYIRQMEDFLLVVEHDVWKPDLLSGHIKTINAVV